MLVCKMCGSADMKTTMSPDGKMTVATCPDCGNVDTFPTAKGYGDKTMQMTPEQHKATMAKGKAKQ